MNKKACIHCHCLFKPARNPQQQFCNQDACQNARKYHWRQQKHKNDPDYRENQNRASKEWRRKNPDYWRSYRATHPEYTDHNRQRQRVYKQNQSAVARFCKNDASQFANSDALASKNTINTGTYRLIHQMHPEFANSDALIVKISVISENYSDNRLAPSVCK